jgi:hypothetical protein
MVRSLVGHRQGSQSVPQFIARVCEDAHRISTSATDKQLNVLDVVVMMILMQGLNDRYETLRENLLLRTDLTTIAMLRATITEQCARIDAEHSDSPLVAHAAHPVASSSKQSVCSFCHKKGHEVNSCYTKFPELREKAANKKLRAKLTKTAKEVKALKAQRVPLQEVEGGSWAAGCKKVCTVPAARHHEDGSTVDMNSNAHVVRALVPHANRAVPPVSPGYRRFEIDSGATQHFQGDARGLTRYDPNFRLEVSLADSSRLPVIGKGDLGNRLKDVHVVPSIADLLSVSSLYVDGKATLFHPHYGIIISEAKDMKVSISDKHILLRGVLNSDGTFTADIAIDSSLNASNSPPLTTSESESDVGNSVVKMHAHDATVATPEVTLATRAQLWFRRLGYPSPQLIRAGIEKGILLGTGLPASIPLEAFGSQASEAKHLGRSQAAPHPARATKRRSSRPLEYIYIDLKVVNKDTYQLARYALYIVDDFSRYTWVHLLQRKNQVAARLREWAAFTTGKLGHRVSNVRLDNAGEHTGRAFKDVMVELEANPEYTNAYSSASNGIVERRIQTGSADGDALRLGASLPIKAWGECVVTGVYLRNFLPCRSLPDHVSPHQVLFGSPPQVSHLRTIGSTAWVHEHKPTRSSLAPRATKGILVGYPAHTNGYRVLMDTRTGEIRETAHVTFVERTTDLPISITSMPGSNADHVVFADDPPLPPSETAEQGEPVPVDDAQHVPDEDLQLAGELMDEDAEDAEDPPARYEEVIVPEQENRRWPDRERRAPERLNISKEDYKSQSYAKSIKMTDPIADRAFRIRIAQSCMAARALSVKIPYREAIRDPRLKAAMRKEIKDLVDLGAIKVVKRPPGANVIGCTWAHKLKYGPLGEFLRAKSRICPWGFQQLLGVDFDADRVNAPTLSLEAAMLLLNLAILRNMYQEQFDIDSAFATTKNHNSHTYMRAPPGIVLKPGYVLRLDNALNGTKQGAFDFNARCDERFRMLGFTPCVIDPCLYYRWRNDKLTLIGVYVDDFRVAADDPADITELEEDLKTAFPSGIKKPGSGWWLGMKLVEDRDKGVLRISQPAYINNLLEQFGMAEAKPCSTPADPGSKLIRAEVQEAAVKDFDMPGLIGSLLWLARTSRPDILYATVQLCSHTRTWNSSHVTAGKRVLRYLSGTKDMELVIRRNPTGEVELEQYADADFAGEPEENGETAMRSMNGALTYIRNVGLVLAQCSLQSTVSRSTAEAEYKSLSAAGATAMSFRQLLEELGFKQSSPTQLHNDNAAAIAIANQRSCGSKMRHIKIAFHHVKELVREKHLTVQYCPTERMIADILTKALPLPQFAALRAVLMGHAGIRPSV